MIWPVVSLLRVVMGDTVGPVRLFVPTPAEARAGLRALKTVLTRQAPLNIIETRLLEAAQTHILRQHHDVESLPVIDPTELADTVRDPGVRAQLINAMVIASFASGDANEQQVEQISTFAEALDIAPPALNTLRRLIRKQLALLRYDILRHMYIGERIAEILDDRGVRGILGLIGNLRGWNEDPQLAARYQALGVLPRETLGREYFEHCRRAGFALPGERYGVIERMVVHDMAHVLGGYATDPAGEMQVAAFTAGFRREQSLHIMLFVLCQFDLGVQMVPVAPPELGTLDPDAFMTALVRGSNMTEDLFDDWDYWAVVDKPLSVLRKRYGIAVAATPPRARTLSDLILVKA
ncbi:MAG: hypothetical protein KUG77_15735 [Nannocystaceae bacterium]|nr:hypothetical protein [Nannocystaceae bacterium]